MNIVRSSAKLSRLSLRQNTSQWACLACRRAYSTGAEAQTPPLLLKLRNDLKTAMRERDASRRDVLKAVFAEVTNASKTTTPIETDVQLLSLLRKKITAADAAMTQFKQAGRQDLVQQEQEQAAILKEYASGISLMSPEDVRQAVMDTVIELRAQEPGLRAGNVMKALFAPGGRLEGKPLDKSTVPGLVKDALANS